MARFLLEFAKSWPRCSRVSRKRPCQRALNSVPPQLLKQLEHASINAKSYSAETAQTAQTCLDRLKHAQPAQLCRRTQCTVSYQHIAGIIGSPGRTPHCSPFRLTRAQNKWSNMCWQVFQLRMLTRDFFRLFQDRGCPTTREEPGCHVSPTVSGL